MTEMTMIDLREMENKINERYRKCADVIIRVIAAITAREDCYEFDIEPCDLTESANTGDDATSKDAIREGIINGFLHQTVPVPRAKISAYWNSRRVVSSDVTFSFDGEVPSVSDVLKLDFGFLMAIKPALTVHYTYKKHLYFDKLKLEHYVADMDDENNKLILQYDSVEDQVLMVEDRTMDISVDIDDYIDGKVTVDDIAGIIYTNAMKLI